MLINIVLFLSTEAFTKDCKDTGLFPWFGFLLNYTRVVCTVAFSLLNAYFVADAVIFYVLACIYLG